MLPHAILYCTVWHQPVLYCTVWHQPVLYCTVWHQPVLYCTVWHQPVLYCTWSHSSPEFTVRYDNESHQLHCTVLYWIVRLTWMLWDILSFCLSSQVARWGPMQQHKKSGCSAMASALDLTNKHGTRKANKPGKKDKQVQKEEENYYTLVTASDHLGIQTIHLLQVIHAISVLVAMIMLDIHHSNCCRSYCTGIDTAMHISPSGSSSTYMST